MLGGWSGYPERPSVRSFQAYFTPRSFQTRFCRAAVFDEVAVRCVVFLLLMGLCRGYGLLRHLVDGAHPFESMSISAAAIFSRLGFTAEFLHKSLLHNAAVC